MRHSFARAAAVTLLVCVLRAGAAGAQGMPDGEVAARTRYLQGALDDEQPAACRWWWFWAGGGVAVAAGQATVAALVSDRDLRDNAIVSAVGTAVGTAPLFLPPFAACFRAGSVRAMPGATPGERLARLRAAEALADDVAGRETFTRSVWNHLLALALATSQGLVLWLAFDQPLSGAISFGSTVGAGALQIYTQPHDMPAAVRQYRAVVRWDDEVTASGARRGALSLGLAPTPGGLAVVGTF